MNRPGPGITTISALSLLMARTTALATVVGGDVVARPGICTPVSSSVRGMVPASRIGPRTITEALTPARRSSVRMTRVNPISPSFAAAEAWVWGTPVLPANEEMFTMCPRPRWSSPGRRRWVSWIGALRFTRSIRSRSSRVRWRNSRCRSPPALFTSTPTGPKTSSAAVMSARWPSGSVTSAWTGIAATTSSSLRNDGVRVRIGTTLTMHGPFVETREGARRLPVRGRRPDAASGMAARIPAARSGGAVALRPLAAR